MAHALRIRLCGCQLDACTDPSSGGSAGANHRADPDPAGRADDGAGPRADGRAERF